MRNKLLILPIALAAAACGGSEKYPEQARDAYLEACVEQPGATLSACTCSLEELESRMSYEEFREAETGILLGREMPDEFVQAIAACRE